MNKLFTKIAALALGAAMVVGVGVSVGSREVSSAYADTSTLTFTAACGGSGTADDGSVWTVTSDGTESVFDANSGIHYGTNSASVTYVQLTTSDISGTVSQVVVNTRDARATATVSVSVGETDFTCSGSATATNTSANYTFTGSDSGEIVVRVDRGSSNTKAIYVKSITVTYSGGSGPTPTTYTITYEGNEPSGTATNMPTNTSTQATNNFVPNSTPELTGYSFVGWNTNQSATTALSTIAISEDTILYAIWEENTPFSSKQYELITSTDDLEINKSYLITNGTSGTVKTMASSEKGNNRDTVDATVANGIITSAASMLSVTLGGSTGAWTFATENYAGTAGYLNATNTTGSNYLKVVASLDDYAYFSVSFNNDAAVITCTGKTSRNVVRYNSNLISCYTSGYSDVYLWKEVVPGYDITSNITNGTASGASRIAEGGVAVVTITPNEGYKLPASVTVSGATQSYNSTNGQITLSNPTGAVSISATCQQKTSYSITKTISNGTASGDTSILEGGTASVTITPNTGFKLPSSVSVTGATPDYNATTGVVGLSSPTGNVTVSATMATATEYSISTSLTNLTASGATSLYENQDVTITLAVTDSTKYSLPTTISVTNSANYEYNSSTGVITLHGASGNVSITASAIAKPAEDSDVITFTDSTQWTVVAADETYERTVGLITVNWDEGTNTTNHPGNFNPGRIYTNHVVTITAATGQGAVTTIKSVTIHTTTTGYASAADSASKTVTSPSTGYGTLSSTTSGNDCVITVTGTVTEFTIKPSAQTRWNSIEVEYMKDQSEVSLNSISATCEPVLVSQKISPTITFDPAGASNKEVSYEFVEETSSLASIDENGVITGLAAGTAKLKITPKDTHADPIVIDVKVNSLPNIYGVEIGKQYAMVSDGYELTGITAGTPNYGTATAYSGEPSNSFPIRVVNGLYARTVALQVTINEETKYLSYNSEGNANSLDLSDSINRESSWIFYENDSSLLIRNVEVYGRYLCFNNRFACYQILSTVPSFVEIPEEKTAKEYVQDFVDLYMHMTDYDQGGSKGSTGGKGWCKDGEYSYYLTAKAGYNTFIYGISDRENLWASDPDFANAKERYEEWAKFNNDAEPYDGNDDVQTKIDPSKSLLVSVLGENSTPVVITIIVSVIGVSALGGFFFLRKRKEI